MKLLVFGASGGVGRRVTEQALACNHDVTAFVRHPERLKIAHDKLRLVQGDALDFDAVDRAIVGPEAVIVALGAPASDKTAVRTKSAHNIVRSMEKRNVKRLICLSSFGIGDTSRLLPLYMKLFIVPFILKDGFADHAEQERIIRESSLDWTIVRPPFLTDGAHTGYYSHGFPNSWGAMRGKISRADAADFLLRQLEDRSYVRKTPAVSY